MANYPAPPIEISNPGLPILAPMAVKTVTPVLLASVMICAANPKRKGFVIFNNSANSTYVGFTAPVDASHCARLIPTFASWEWSNLICYTGPMYAIRNAGSGDLTVWELT